MRRILKLTGVTESWITTDFRPNCQFWITALSTSDGGSIAPAVLRYLRQSAPQLPPICAPAYRTFVRSRHHDVAGPIRRFIFSFIIRAATRLRFDLKEK